jgi:hypothetical protein
MATSSGYGRSRVIDSGLRNQPTVVDGAVYANTVDGLYAFGPPG